MDADNYTEVAGSNLDLNVPVYLTFTILLFIFGVIGNLFIILSVLMNKQLQARGYVFTCNLAASDFIDVILSDLFIILGIATKGKIFHNDNNFCVMTSFFCLAFCVTSVWNIAVGSFHSYVRICHHLSYHKIFKGKVVTLALLIPWFIGITLLTPTVVGWGGHYYNQYLRFCIYNYQASFSYTLMMVSIGFIAPFALATYSFGRIYAKVIASQRRLRRMSDLKNPVVRSKRRAPFGGIRIKDTRLFRSFLIVFLYLAFSWLFLIVIWVYGSSATWTPSEMAFAMTFAHSHCSVNGVLYAITNKDFRKACKHFLKCGKTDNSQTSTTQERL